MEVCAGRRYVLQVQENPTGIQQIEDFGVESSFSLVRT
jgi:hypothetical protein